MLLNLPLELFSEVCSWLEDEVLLELNQVSQLGGELVEGYLDNHLRDKYQILKQENPRWTLALVIKSRRIIQPPGTISLGLDGFGSIGEELIRISSTKDRRGVLFYISQIELALDSENESLVIYFIREFNTIIGGIDLVLYLLTIRGKSNLIQLILDQSNSDWRFLPGEETLEPFPYFRSTVTIHQRNLFKRIMYLAFKYGHPEIVERLYKEWLPKYQGSSIEYFRDLTRNLSYRLGVK